MTQALKYGLRTFPCVERSGETRPIRRGQVEEKGKNEDAVSLGGKNRT